MCLAVATGRCWHTLARQIPNFRPIDPRRVVHVGARDWSPGEREALLRDGVRLEADFDGIDAKRMLVHVDLDVINAKYGRANHYACEGGPSPDEVLETIERARKRFQIVGLVIASYDPSCDTDGRIADAALRIVRVLSS
jgi:arginase